MLVDTSVWVDHFNGYESTPQARLDRALRDDEPVLLCGIVLTEILMGLGAEAEAARIADLLRAFDFVPDPVSDDYVAAAGLFRACRARGLTIRSTIDCVIAQLCIRDGTPLLTKDRDFSSIARVAPLRLVDLARR